MIGERASDFIRNGIGPEHHLNFRSIPVVHLRAGETRGVTA